MDRPELPRASRRSRDDGTPRPGRSRPGRLNRRRIPMNATVALRIERQDGAHGFDDPAVPGGWTIWAVTARAVLKLRYPKTDVSSVKLLGYSLLHDWLELPHGQTVDTVYPQRRARLHVVRDG